MVTILTGALALLQGSNAPQVTVYSQGFALVKESRQFNLKSGRQTIEVEDVAQLIDSTSVGFKNRTSGVSLSVLEQNYQYDLISPIALLNKAVGARVTFSRTVAGVRDVVSGTLLSPPTSINTSAGDRAYTGMVIRTDEGHIILDPVGEVQVDKIPSGMRSRPTLVWDVMADKAGLAQVELSYITQGMSWNADYVLTLDGKGQADLQGWVSMVNRSGTTYENAKLKLLAGDVNQVREVSRAASALRMEAMNSAFADKGFKEEGLFEYHLYTLQRPATLLNNETKQLSLLEGHGVKVRKRLILDSMEGFRNYYPGRGEVGTGNIKPLVRVEFLNELSNHLGMPMPKGRVRVFQRDSQGSVQMLGEDQIDHTPTKERLSLKVGKSFDVVSSRKRTEFKTFDDPRHIQESFSIEVRNRKDVPETIEIFERHWGDWTITKKSQEFTKEDSNTAVFTIFMKPGEVRTVTYTVDTRW